MAEANNSEFWASLDEKRRIPRFAIRLSDRESAQLKLIAEATPESMHEFCIKAIRAAIEEKLVSKAEEGPDRKTARNQRVQCPKCRHALFDLCS